MTWFRHTPVLAREYRLDPDEGDHCASHREASSPSAEPARGGGRASQAQEAASAGPLGLSSACPWTGLDK